VPDILETNVETNLKNKLEKIGTYLDLAEPPDCEEVEDCDPTETQQDDIVVFEKDVDSADNTNALEQPEQIKNPQIKSLGLLKLMEN
jgi:hypothetical protein